MEKLRDFKHKEFLFHGRVALIFYPDTESNGKLILKTEYLDAFPHFEIAMLHRGYTVCFVSHPTRWAPDSETAIMAEFVHFVADELGFAHKCIPVGMSCGGLQAVRLAELYPELISVMFLDAPVLNLISMVGLGALKKERADLFWPEISNTYSLTRSSIVNFRKSPIDNMQPLIDHHIPIYLLYGDADDVVIYDENGAVLADFYRQHGGDIAVVRCPGRGHHPHSLEDPTPIIEFVESRLAMQEEANV